MDIEPQFGQIVVAKDFAFDYDKANPIFVQVQAVDHAEHTGTAQLTINLEDVNNKAPVITVVSILNQKLTKMLYLLFFFISYVYVFSVKQKFKK